MSDNTFVYVGGESVPCEIVHDEANPQWFAFNVCKDDQHEWGEWTERTFTATYRERRCTKPGCDCVEAHAIEPDHANVD